MSLHDSMFFGLVGWYLTPTKELVVILSRVLRKGIRKELLKLSLYVVVVQLWRVSRSLVRHLDLVPF